MTAAVRKARRANGAPAQLRLAGIDAAPLPLDHLFFAIFPEMGTAERVARLAPQWRAEHGLRGNLIDTERLHVTLLSVGNYAGLPQAVVDLASYVAAAVAMPPFEVSFDSVMSFKGGPFVLRGSNNAPALMALKALRRELAFAMNKAGLPCAAESNYTPHLTLLYGDKLIPEQIVETVSWTVREFVLVYSLQSQHLHLHLKRWPLRD